MIHDFLSRAKSGESIFIDEVDSAFAGSPNKVVCRIDLAIGGQEQFLIELPQISGDNAEEIAFIHEYFYAWIYNMISTFGGRQMTLYTQPGNAFTENLCASLDNVFQLNVPKKERSGYGKCLNVTDRVNASLGYPPFRFVYCCQEPAASAVSEKPASNAAEHFLNAVEKSQTGRYCGIDIGGTDIKVVGICDKSICAVREYDWNPSLFKTTEPFFDPVEKLTRAVRAALSLPESSSDEAKALCSTMLAGSTPLDEADMIAARLEELYPPIPLDGIGVSFPDVIIRDMIVGGETLKTRGMREANEDYDSEFAKMRTLKDRLGAFCTPDASFHMANDGSLAAYTAAVEWAFSETDRARIPDGVFAHTLGTELGSGWVDEEGQIPQIPLEIYNCIIDLGDYPARKYAADDIRSVQNFNTNLNGTLQKYACQYGAYRIALKKFLAEAPEEYKKLFDLGYLYENERGVFVVTKPKDMRKALLEYLMNLACEGQPQAEEVFREIGRTLSVTTYVTNKLLAPKARSRVLFGRFVKKPRCFELMQEGANLHFPVELIAADGGLAFTPQMLELDRDPVYTVAQFGQAVGALFYSNS